MFNVRSNPPVMLIMSMVRQLGFCGMRGALSLHKGGRAGHTSCSYRLPSSPGPLVLAILYLFSDSAFAIAYDRKFRAHPISSR